MWSKSSSQRFHGIRPEHVNQSRSPFLAHSFPSLSLGIEKAFFDWFSTLRIGKAFVIHLPQRLWTEKAIPSLFLNKESHDHRESAHLPSWVSELRRLFTMGFPKLVNWEGHYHICPTVVCDWTKYIFVTLEIKQSTPIIKLIRQHIWR